MNTMRRFQRVKDECQHTQQLASIIHMKQVHADPPAKSSNSIAAHAVMHFDTEVLLQVTERCRQAANLIVQVVEDASSSHLLEEFIAADRLEGATVCSRPLAALHQDCSWCAVQQGRNGDEPKQVNAVNVLQGIDTTYSTLCYKVMLNVVLAAGQEQCAIMTMLQSHVARTTCI